MVCVIADSQWISGRIMGGLGSGRHGERENTLFVDDCDALRVWDLQRRGDLKPGKVVQTSQYFRPGRVSLLVIDASDPNSAWLEIDGQHVELATSPGTKGGLRWWFVCSASRKRVACLYRHPYRRRFEGRQAAGLRYRSAYQGDYEVDLLRAQKALSRLAGRPYTPSRNRDPRHITRPYRQRWTTYARNRRRAEQALARADERLEGILAGMLARTMWGRMQRLDSKDLDLEEFPWGFD